MDKQQDQNIGGQRRLSQVKVLSRLIEHELGAAKGSKDVTLQRELVENVLDVLEVYVEDVERGGGDARARAAEAQKPAVTRLN